MAHGVSTAGLAGFRRMSGRGTAFVLLLLLLGCSSPSQEPIRVAGSPTGPEQTFVGLELRETTAGKLEWKLWASRAVRANASSATGMESLRVEFFEGRPEVRSVLTSDSGRVDLSRGGTAIR